MGEVSGCLIAEQCFLVHVHELLLYSEVVVSNSKHGDSIFQLFRERDVIGTLIASFLRQMAHQQGGLHNNNGLVCIHHCIFMSA